MSLSIDSTAASASILKQLNDMQSQLQTLARQATPQTAHVQSETDETAQVAINDTKPAAKASESIGQFQAMLQNAFEDMNILQNTSSVMQSRFDVGDRSLSLADVMIASQKASLSFEATLQIRNKMVDAYKSIMQMNV
ncbi:Flagellar hook-basal body complex protein FliE [Anaerobiospirillum thomasii]|uniref:Flagellar hook-basal body complex protein FliE n=1 Tax=Anaerobiospirillum thomasii TaxID=179995 RepID=A0A2X0VC47_9GAMM|nr:flagellar hook-basal body complex protein FliE [Anaerobiospirillum thomasii]SPT70756.1 Flagellar hook-basal body complex protein FliE [Anaerobiospirillum thomasii]SPT71627.1 Flagellar hook-basal body complex protein FliE [Anaerobiospirillum thomasii]